MFKTRFISILALLLMAVSGAWAQTYTVTFSGAYSGSLNKAINNVTMPYSFSAVNGQNLSPWNVIAAEVNDYLYVGVSSGGEGKVSILYDTTNTTITISGAFEGTATIHCIGLNDGEISRDVYVTCVENKVAVNSVTLAPTSATLTLGETETVTLIPTVLPGDATDKSVTWSSSDEAVATVTDGVVTAKAAGTATITATATNGTADTSDDKTATCTVTVTVPVSGVTLSQTEAALNISETLTLTPTVLPAEATNKTVAWTTSDASVATVADGVVTAVAPGTATITATATNGTADTSDDKTATCEVTVADPATKYDLTKADGSEAHGTVAFTVGGNAATQAKKDDVVTVSVTPAEGYSAKDVTVRGYTSWEAASEILAGGGDNPSLVSDINVTKNEENGTWSFTMPEANVWVVVTYTKNLQDAWIQAIADQTYTGSAITPTVTVMDGETTLVLNTDYTVAYSNNVETGTATVTVTGTGNYSGTATANFTIVADKSALNTAITEAETYYNSIKDDHAEAAAALKTAIDTAKGMQEKGDATQEEVNNALSALNTAKTTAEDAVLTETKTTLNDDITEAEAYYTSIKDDHTAAANTLKEAIDAAKAVKDNADATQAEVEAAIAALASAKTTAEQTVLTETKTALNDDITEAEAYYNSIKDSNPAAAATLLDAINAAKTVKDNADATQAEVEAAIAALSTAINTAKVEVSRVTLTIPAKSYMARIDADKRQIETAVAGVKLFSVNNVTNTEVVLTAELSVIAAEMPYFIYNDNDTEVEVSIIVSSEEADNVDYDSEHFKGTLVDKTFTAEDMQQADHYVLSNGHSFVWVKDAGTLAAGKCWIELAKAAGASSLSIVPENDGFTGISLTQALSEGEGVCYDLSGRRVAKPAKGLYIVNGKKIVVK